jgi:hypothetical protein
MEDNMTLKKYGDNQEAEVFRGEEATVVNKHIAKTGKAVSDFDTKELDALQDELEQVRAESQSNVENKPAAGGDVAKDGANTQDVKESDSKDGTSTK